VSESAAMKRGATDFVPKPWSNDRLVATVRTAAALRRSRVAAGALDRLDEAVWLGLRDQGALRLGKCLPPGGGGCGHLQFFLQRVDVLPHPQATGLHSAGGCRRGRGPRASLVVHRVCGQALPATAARRLANVSGTKLVHFEHTRPDEMEPSLTIL
jgi:choline dehydrogenase-like flavoprotein